MWGLGWRQRVPLPLPPPPTGTPAPCTHLVLAWQGASWEGGGESRNEGLVRQWVDLYVLGLQVWTANGIEQLTVRQRNAGGSGTAGGILRAS